jgi:hypothetical protein
MQHNLIKRTQGQSVPEGDNSDYTSLNNGSAKHNKIRYTRTIQDIITTLVKYTYKTQFYNKQAPDTPPITKTWEKNRKLYL